MTNIGGRISGCGEGAGHAHQWQRIEGNASHRRSVSLGLGNHEDIGRGPTETHNARIFVGGHQFAEQILAVRGGIVIWFQVGHDFTQKSQKSSQHPTNLKVARDIRTNAQRIPELVITSIICNFAIHEMHHAFVFGEENTILTWTRML